VISGECLLSLHQYHHYEILPCSDACKSTWGMRVTADRENFMGRIEWCIFSYVNFLQKRTLERKLSGNAIEMLIDI